MKPKKFLTQKKIDKLQALIDDNNGVVNHEDILPLLKSYKKQLLIQRNTAMSSAGITALTLIRVLTAPASFLSVGIN